MNKNILAISLVSAGLIASGIILMLGKKELPKRPLNFEEKISKVDEAYFQPLEKQFNFKYS